MDVGLLTQAAGASMQTRASSWRVRARAACPNTSPKPRGGHSGIQNQAGQKTCVEQASESDISGTSESRSQDKEEEKEKDNMSASKTRRTKQQAHRRKAYAIGQAPKDIHKGRILLSISLWSYAA